jgi:hypothetical protein
MYGKVKHYLELYKMAECPVCYEPEKNWRGSTKAVCGHILCMTCFIAHTKNATVCPLCRRNYLESQADEEDEEDEEDEGSHMITGGVGMFSNFLENQNNVDEEEGCYCPDNECTCDDEQDGCHCPDNECTCDDEQDGCQCPDNECTCQWEEWDMEDE